MVDKFYYQNLLFNQNITAKPNIVWSADITSLELNNNQKLYVFLYIDIYTNVVMAYKTSKKTFTSKTIINYLIKAIDKRFPFVLNRKLIIHTDRGTQFSSKTYKNFIDKYSTIFIPSMSRENTPTDNAVAERFMRTFKNHKIDGITIQETIFDTLLDNPTRKPFRPFIKKYIKSINKKPNKKSIPKSPERYNNSSKTASILMDEPKYTKAHSSHFGNDPKLFEINNFKRENAKVIGLLEKIAAKKTEIVDKTSFDTIKDNIVLQVL